MIDQKLLDELSAAKAEYTLATSRRKRAQEAIGESARAEQEAHHRYQKAIGAIEDAA